MFIRRYKLCIAVAGYKNKFISLRIMEIKIWFTGITCGHSRIHFGIGIDKHTFFVNILDCAYITWTGGKCILPDKLKFLCHRVNRFSIHWIIRIISICKIIIINITCTIYKITISFVTFCIVIVVAYKNYIGFGKIKRNISGSAFVNVIIFLCACGTYFFVSIGIFSATKE